MNRRKIAMTRHGNKMLEDRKQGLITDITKQRKLNMYAHNFPQQEVIQYAQGHKSFTNGDTRY